MNKRFTALNATEALEFSREGFLSGRSVIFAAGIFLYRTFELGLPFDYTEDGIVRVYYSEEEVRRALPSFDNNVITNDHPDTPDGLIDVTNYEGNSQGTLGSGATLDENNQVIALTHFKGKSVVTDIIAGKRDVSVGLSMAMELVRGTAPNGERYDARGVAIAGNHCALVDRGRVSSARVILGDENDNAPSRILLNGFPSVDRDLPSVDFAPADYKPTTVCSLNSMSKQGTNPMTKENPNVIVTLNGADYTFADKDSADIAKSLLNSANELHKTEVASLNSTHEEAVTALNAEVTDLKTQNAELVASNTPEAIALNAARRLEIIAKAESRGVALNDAETATNNNLELQVLNASDLPNASDYNANTQPELVSHVFNALTAEAPTKADENPFKGTTATNAGSTNADDVYRQQMLNPASRTLK